MNRELNPNDSVSVKNRLVCYDCGFPINDPGTIVCPQCGGQDIDARHARPTIRNITRAPLTLPHPWTPLQIGEGGSVLLSGNAGSGKTTICLGLNPTRFCSSEQEIYKLQDDWHRIVKQHDPEAQTPLFSSINSWEELHDDLINLERGEIIVVDSISQLTSSASTPMVVKHVVENVRYAGAYVYFIAQYTKDGDMLGPNALRHLVDVVCEIPDDSMGMRRLSVYKNRYGSTFVSYFTISNKGVEKVEFPYAYSVEGSAGKYNLHLYPLTGAKLTGIFDLLSEKGVAISNVASAAIACNLYPEGFAEPADVMFRREFAERHGLTWIDPKTANDLLTDPKD